MFGYIDPQDFNAIRLSQQSSYEETTQPSEVRDPTMATA